MSYYYDEEQKLPAQRPSLGWRLILIGAALVPILLTVFIIFWFIRAYIAPPKVAVLPQLDPAAVDLPKDPGDAREAGPPPPDLASQASAAVPTTRAPAYADVDPAVPTAPLPASPWPAAAAPASPPAASPWSVGTVTGREPAASPADAVAARSLAVEKVPLPRRRPADAIAAADPSGVIPMPRNRPPPAIDPVPAEVPAPPADRTDHNF